MENTTRPTDGVKVRLGDKEFTLRYTLAAMREAKKEFGGSITHADTLNRMDEDKLGKLIWYGLRAHHPDVTVERVEELVDYKQLPDIMTAYAQALGASMPEPKNEQSPTAEPIAKSTGSSSGPSAVTTSGSQTPSSGT